MSNDSYHSLPRVSITYCTQCKWLLRAAYYAQELLSTFSTTLGEVALVPGTGGVFKVHLIHRNPASLPSNIHEGDESKKLENEREDAAGILLWDFKIERSFPETKILKQRVRDHIEPARNLGHSDTPVKRAGAEKAEDIKQTDIPFG